MTSSAGKPANHLERILELLAELDRRGIPYSLASSRADALMVLVAIPGQRWEIEFMRDGEIEVERFTSGGDIGDEEWLEELWKLLEA